MFKDCVEFNGDLSNWERGRRGRIEDPIELRSSPDRSNNVAIGPLGPLFDPTQGSDRVAPDRNVVAPIELCSSPRSERSSSTSNVQDMSGMFQSCNKFNGDLSNWDTSNVRDMSDMFWNCFKFNGDLSKWNTSNVQNTSWMFQNCNKFNGDLSNWDTSKVQNMYMMFLLVWKVQR